MATMQESMRQKSLSPLGKDPHKVGKLFNRTKQIAIQDNPQEFTPSFPIVQPKEIGVNTSKIGIQYAPEVQLIARKQPQHQIMKETKNSFKLHSSVFDLKLRSTARNEEMRKSAEKVFAKKNQERSPIGTIRKQPKSAPKDLAYKLSETSPQLPSINKIEKSISGFRSFVDTSIGSPSQMEAKKKIVPSSRGDTRVSGRRNSKKFDSEQNEKLSKYQFNRTSNNRSVNSRVKLPTFKDESKIELNEFKNTSQYHTFQQNQMEKSLKTPKSKHSHKNESQIEEVDPLAHSKYHPKQIQNENYSQFYQQNQSSSYTTNHGNNFLMSRINMKADSHVSIDLRTSISRLKQILVQTKEQLHASFIVPEIFFSPPSSSSSSQELHMLMLEVFSHIGITPQIVSIKKYVNCVVLREKNLCILWNFNGKIYFGGWKRNDNMSEGNKHGVGIEWIPSRYIYYGQFKDNKKDGYGIMKKSNKQVYIGCWKNNQRWGWGKLYDPEGNLHQSGQFVEGCFVAEEKQLYVDK